MRTCFRLSPVFVNKEKRFQKKGVLIHLDTASREAWFHSSSKWLRIHLAKGVISSSSSETCIDCPEKYCSGIRQNPEECEAVALGSSTPGQTSESAWKNNSWPWPSVAFATSVHRLPWRLGRKACRLKNRRLHWNLAFLSEWPWKDQLMVYESQHIQHPSARERVQICVFCKICTYDDIQMWICNKYHVICKRLLFLISCFRFLFCYFCLASSWFSMFVELQSVHLAVLLLLLFLLCILDLWDIVAQNDQSKKACQCPPTHRSPDRPSFQ